ncbi:MAG: CsbD family protein [Gammaproteobacteria bacterium]
MWHQIAGNWNQVKGKVKQQWGDLTDDELTVIEGNRDMLIGKIQKQYGISKQEAEQQVDSWAKTL